MPRTSIFGGSWMNGENAGSRYANLDYWPDNSDDNVGARGRCDDRILTGATSIRAFTPIFDAVPVTRRRLRSRRSSTCGLLVGHSAADFAPFGRAARRRDGGSLHRWSARLSCFGEDTPRSGRAGRSEARLVSSRPAAGLNRGGGAMTPVTLLGGRVKLYLGDCREILPTIALPDDLASIFDPPYGNKHSGDSSRFSGGKSRRGRGSTHGRIAGDGEPFDPRPFMLGRAQIIFGANYFPHHLSPGSLLVWAKRRPAAYGTFLGDAEVAWFSEGNGIYMIEHVFAGAAIALEYTSDATAPSAHPFQKPIAVMRWCIEHLPGGCNTILDAFMGSGTTGVAAVELGHEFIGIEKEPKYFDIACRRIEAASLQPRLFVEKPSPPTQEALQL